MSCKCGAQTYAGHFRKFKAGYPAHCYRGFYWAPKEDADEMQRDRLPSNGSGAVGDSVAGSGS